ncbi:MAG: GNAT family N-acetyltransferase [Myxococcota bacterium]|nr:GNAT family N-acetyltransferase [Myxococcota bacterium]
MRVRAELRPEDRDAIEQIVRGVAVFRADEIEVAMELVDAGLSEDDLGYQFAIAEDDDDRVIGYACWGLAPMTDATYDLYWIAVDVTLHRSGVGRALLAACEEDVRAREGRLLLIETEGTDAYEPTRRFYLRAGYPEIARVRDYYREGADKVMYGRRLR